ncbi:hypothetical protein BB559_004371 [Furculomyces boomerangus]|uniref:Sm protein B n=2 Tax=Harpellales TaxID=61421 RepID=A0A2T9YF34_9FUNG|nr:hypothetical protein BB559_004371 [Furculomyces boomerangus]PWA02004.1 hypothetical protein BB558_001863 [Smittium angustum]
MSKNSKMMKILNHRLRLTLSDGRVFTGQMLAFDKHMNLVLSECEEFRQLKVRSSGSKTQQKPNVREIKRLLGLVVLRGDIIVSMSIDGPPPVSVESVMEKNRGYEMGGLQAGPGIARPAARALPLSGNALSAAATTASSAAMGLQQPGIGSMAPGAPMGLSGPVRGIGGPIPGMMQPRGPPGGMGGSAQFGGPPGSVYPRGVPPPPGYRPGMPIPPQAQQGFRPMVPPGARPPPGYPSQPPPPGYPGQAPIPLGFRPPPPTSGQNSPNPTQRPPPNQ